MTNRVNLKTIGIEFDTDWTFRDEGFVKDIRTRAIEVVREIHPRLDPIREVDRVVTKETKGICIHNFDTEEAVIFYSRTHHPETQAYVIGHEETHALHFMGKIKLLEKRLKQIGYNIVIPSNTIKNPLSYEIVANIGAVYALLRQGLDLAECQKRLSRRNPELEPTYTTIFSHFRDKRSKMEDHQEETK